VPSELPWLDVWVERGWREARIAVKGPRHAQSGQPRDKSNAIRKTVTGRPKRLQRFCLVSLLLPLPALWSSAILSQPLIARTLTDKSSSPVQLPNHHGKSCDVVRYISDGIIGRHRSQPDVHIPAICRRTVTTVIRAQLRDVADPPYGICMFVRRRRWQRCDSPIEHRYACAPSTGVVAIFGCCYGSLGSSQKSAQNPHAMRLRCRCSMLDA
jgi:hypothetical protein